MMNPYFEGWLEGLERATQAARQSYTDGNVPRLGYWAMQARYCAAQLREEVGGREDPAHEPGDVCSVCGGHCCNLCGLFVAAGGQVYCAACHDKDGRPMAQVRGL